MRARVLSLFLVLRFALGNHWHPVDGFSQWRVFHGTAQLLHLRVMFDVKQQQCRLEECGNVVRQSM